MTVAGLAGAVVLWSGGPAQAGVPSYSVQFLGTAVHAHALNESGEATGWTSIGGFARAWAYTAGTGMTLLPLPEGMTSSLPQDINDAGVIVGSVQVDILDEPGRAAVWTPNGSGYDVELLGALPGHTRSVATAVNDVGDIVGYSVLPGFSGGPAVLFTDPGGIVDLGSTLGFTETPTAINDARQVVGGQLRMDLDDGTIENLGRPAGNYLFAEIQAINESGQVAGYAVTSITQNPRRAVRHTEAGWEEVDFGVGIWNAAYGINADGDVSFEAPGGIYLDGIGSSTLSNLLRPEDSGWSIVTYTFGCDVNDAGQVLVIGEHAGLGQSGAILLTPDSAADAGAVAGEERLRVVASPNPFETGSTLTLQLTRSERVRVDLYDAQGREVVSLWDGLAEPGSLSLGWNGLRSDGREAAPGVYFARVQTPSGSFGTRIVRVR